MMTTRRTDIMRNNACAENVANRIWHRAFSIRADFHTALTTNLLAKLIKPIDSPLLPPRITDEVLWFVELADALFHRLQPADADPS